MADKQHHHQNLTKLLSAGFFICGIIPILIIATTSIYNSKQVAIKDIEVTASQVIQHRQDVINNYLDHQVDFLTTLISLYPLNYLKDQNNLNQLFLAISASGNMVDLQLIDTNGQQPAYVGPYREQVTYENYQDQPCFSEILVRGAHVSDVFSGFRKIPHFVVALTDQLKRDALRTTIHSNIFNSLFLSVQIGTMGGQEVGLIRHHSNLELVLAGDNLYATTWLLMLKVMISDLLGTYYQHLNRPLGGSIEAHSKEGEATVFTVKVRSTNFNKPDKGEQT
jgi:two-component system NtrC family sensor kinase